ncbi:hypothetical protein [Priestia aryabhattai]|uniref:hypothetical protein n=1 Tax=Priestia aryabhattai TaxID=412384 RepID=UPI003B66D187
MKANLKLNYEKLCKYLKFHDKQYNIFLPNEIFEDLKQIKNVQHRAFAYSYIYLITWLWRYSKYGDLEYSQLSQKKIKETLGRKSDERINYLIKKDGVLEQMKWIESVKDFPIFNQSEGEKYYIERLDKEIWNINVELTFVSEMKGEDVWKYVRPPARFTAKKPVRAYTRYPNDPEMEEDYNSGYCDGTFESIENTHSVPFQVFLYSMTNRNVGTKGFYIYSYLYFKNKLFRDGYDVTVPNLATQLKVAQSTVQEWLDIVRRYCMVEVKHNQTHFVVGMRKEDRKASTYITNNFTSFTTKPVKYNKMPVMKRSQYFALLKEQQEEIDRKQKEKRGIDIPLDQLPF